jgi:hypothetical protein
MNRRIFTLAALALTGCATRLPPILAPATSGLAELEPLYRADAGREALTISVASNGCTAKADFAFYVERRGEAVTLAFGRKRIDTCQSFAMGRTDISFSWTELGVAPRTPVFLLNPLIGWTGPGR